MSFDAAFQRTVGTEGHYSNDSQDSGGETCWGITVAVARENGYTGPMISMPIDVAKAIYRKRYWQQLMLDAVDAVAPALAIEVFDIGVLSGQPTAGRYLQRALNVLNNMGTLYPDIPVDGNVGAGTISALVAYVTLRGMRGVQVIVRAVLALKGNNFIETCEHRPKDERFVYGWLLSRMGT